MTTRSITRRHIGSEAEPLVIIDGFAGDPDGLRAAAAEAAFVSAGQHYPGIRAALPDANVPISIRETAMPVHYGQFDELDGLSAEGTMIVIDDHPERAKGLEFDLVVLIDPQRWSAVDQYVAMTRATQRLVILRRAE